MPKSLSVKKRARQSQKRKERNQQVKAKIKNLVKKVEKSSHWEEAIKSLKEVTKLLDKAAKLKVIHKSKVSRTKSRLAKLANSIKKKAE